MSPVAVVVEEWLARFWNGKDLLSALVLKVPDVFAAAQRVKDEFPAARIHAIEEVLSEEDHPMGYLDEHHIILPVGGPRVPRTPETKQ